MHDACEKTAQFEVSQCTCLDMRSRNGMGALLMQEVVDAIACSSDADLQEGHYARKFVALCNQDQVLPGQIRRLETRRLPHGKIFDRVWESMVAHSSRTKQTLRVRSFGDRISSLHHPTTTIVTPKQRDTELHSWKSDEHFVVSSQAGKRYLHHEFRIPSETIQVKYPCIRRYFAKTDSLPAVERSLNLIVYDDESSKSAGDLDADLRSSRVPVQKVHVESQDFLMAPRFRRLLAQSAKCFYLPNNVFDWPIAVVESIFTGVSCEFASSHPVLAEIFGSFAPSNHSELVQAADMLRKHGAFSPMVWSCDRIH